jgi:hypothetical protein
LLQKYHYDLTFDALLQYVSKPTLEHVKTAFRRFKKEHEAALREI